MARRIFRKPIFISLLSTGTSFHFPKDNILLQWEVKGAVFVKTNLSKQLYPRHKTITLPATLGPKRIIITAYGLFGRTTEVILLSKNAIETAPDFATLIPVQLRSEKVSIECSSLPSKIELETRLRPLSLQKTKFSPLISKVHIYANNGTKGELSGIGISLPEINIYE